MKTKFSVKSLIAVVLTICMLTSALPMQAIAQGFEDDFFNKSETGTVRNEYDIDGNGYVDYVSLGDSLTAGFGMDGYFNKSYDVNDPYKIPSIGEVTQFGDANPYGLNNQVADTYPALLNQYFNGDNTEHWYPLAMSSMRIEEFVYMLKGGNWPQDHLTDTQKDDGTWQSWGYKEKLKEIQTDFVSKIEKAEVVSIKLGDYSFASALDIRLNALLDGTFGNSEYKNMTTKWLFEQFPEYGYLKDYYNQMVPEMQAKLTELLGASNSLLVTEVVDALAYFALSYIINYEEAMKELRAINPKAKIIVIGMGNFLDGLSFDVNGTVMDLGDIFQVAVDVIDLHRATVGDNMDGIFVKMPEGYTLISDELAGEGTQVSTVLRFLCAIIEEFGVSDLAIDKVKKQLRNAWTTEIYAGATYEAYFTNELSQDNLLKMWMTLYLNGIDNDLTNDLSMDSTEYTFVKALKEGLATSKATIEAGINRVKTGLLSNTSLDADVINSMTWSIETYESNINTLSVASALADDHTNLVKGIAAYNESVQLIAYLENAFATLLNGMYGVITGMCKRPDTYSQDDLMEAFAQKDNMQKYVADEFMKKLEDSSYEITGGAALLAYLYLRVKIGGGLLGHPGVKGHQQVFEAIVNAIEGNYTGADYVTDYAEYILSLVKAYGPDILRAVYGWAEKEGYFDGAQAFATDLELSLTKWEALIAAAGKDPAALHAAVDTIAADIMALMEKHQIAELASLVKSYLQKAADFLAPYADEFGMLVLGLIYLYGPEGLDKFYNYIANAKNIDDVLNTDVDGDGKLDYVSFGASQTNGYGMQGYLPESLKNNVANYATANIYGFKLSPDGSYTDLLKEYFEAKGEEVELHQMAISSMRAEELHVLLNNNYYGDAYTDWRFTGSEDGKWFNLASAERNPDGSIKQIGSLDKTREEYQNAVKQADLITLDIGVNNFGVYLSNEIMPAMNGGSWVGHDVSTLDAQYIGYYTQLREYLLSVAPQVAGYEGAIDTIAYAFLGFCQNFDASIAKIREMNPNATIVVVPVQNLIAEMKLEMNGMQIDIGAIVGELTNAANLYTAAISPMCTEYLYAQDVRTNGKQHVDFFIEDLLAYNGDPTTLHADMKDFCDYYNATTMWAEIPGIPGRLPMNINGVAAAMQTAYAPATAEQLTNAGYDVFISVMQYGAQFDTADIGSLGRMSTALYYVNRVILDDILASWAALAAGTYTDYKVEGDFVARVVEKAAADNFTREEIVSALAFGIRADYGNCFFGHPNRNGHQQTADAIISALENGTTGKDFVIDYAKDMADKLADLVATYGPEVLKALLAYADANGYFDGAYALKAELEAKIAQWTALLEQVKDDTKTLTAVCEQIVNEFTALLKSYNAEARIAKIYAIVNEIIDLIESSEGNLANALYALIERYGTDAVDMIINYLDSIGCFDEAKALKAAVETKIADWKALIAAAGNDPVALLAAACQIAEEAWALVEQFDLEAKAEKALEIINNVVNVMLNSGENLGNAIYALVEQYGADALAAIVAIIEKSGYLNESQAYIDAIKANVNNWIAMIEAIPTNNVEMLMAVCQNIANELKALAEKLDCADAQALLTGIFSSAAKVFGDLAAEYGDEIAAVLGVAGSAAAYLIYNYLLDNGCIDHANIKIEELKTMVEKWKNDIESMTKDDYVAYAKQIAQYLLTNVGMTEENFNAMCTWAEMIVKFYQANIEDKTMEELKAVLIDMMKLYGEEAFDKFVEYLEAAGHLKLAEEQVNALKAQIAIWKAELAEILANSKNIDLETALNTLAGKVWQYMIGAGLIPVDEINAVKALVEEILNFYYTKIEGATKQELLDVLTDLIRAYGEKAFDKFVDYLEEQGYVDAASAKAEALRAQVEAWKNQYLALKNRVESITDEDVIAFAEDVWNYIVDNKLITIDNIQNLLNWAKAEVLTHIEVLESTVQQLLNKAAQMGVLSEDMVIEIVAKINELKSFVEGVSVDIDGMINDLIKTATTTTYTITGKDNYLVLGSNTAFGTGVGRDDSLYSELLFNQIFDKNGNYSNAAVENLTYTDILTYLAGLEEEIAKATLITYQQDAGALLYAAINNSAPNWSVYLSDEQIAMANEIIENAIARLPKNVNIEVLSIVRPMIENTVYAIIGYAIDTMKGIEYINSINSDVSIVIPGMYNPIRGIKLDVKGIIIDLENVFEYVIDATNVYYFACGAAYENVTFVDVSETETKGFDSVIAIDSPDYSALVSVLRGDGMYATAAGHEYIYECIINAVTFEYELIGDVNVDGTVTVADVVLLYQYLLNKAELSEQAQANGDVNLDGEITMADITTLYLMIRNMDE